MIVGTADPSGVLALPQFEVLRTVVAASFVPVVGVLVAFEIPTQLRFQVLVERDGRWCIAHPHGSNVPE